MNFFAVAMTAVDHNRRAKIVLFEQTGCSGDVLSGVVGSRVPTTKDDVAILVARCRNDGGEALLCDSQKTVRVACRPDGIDGDLHVAARAVFEAYGARETTRELAVNLGLSGTRANSAPADKVRDKLRRIESRNSQPGESEFIYVEEKLAATTRLMLNVPLRWGSLIRPSQPTVVRGFSK